MRRQSGSANILRKCLSTGSARAFLESDESASEPSATAISRRIYLNQLLALDRFSRTTLKAHVLEDPGVPFDRLLLKYSEPYRHTRRLAHGLGAVLAPKMMRNEVNIRTWDPGDHRIHYSPIVPRLRKVLERGDFTRSSWREVERLKGHFRSVFHDLNHYIIFMLVRPHRDASVNVIDVLRYYRFVESLVRMRDMEFAEDLGDVGVALSGVGVLECALSDRDVAAVKPWKDFESFVSTFIYLYFQRLSHKRSAIHEAFRAEDRVLPSHPLRAVSENALFRNNSMWWRHYLARFGGKLRFPPEPKSRRRSYPRCEIQVRSPRELLRRPELLRDVYRWYGQTLGAGN